MNKSSKRTFSGRYNRVLLKLVSIGWQKLFSIEKMLKRKIFIQEFEARKDDICVVTYMRSGTTLVQMMLYQLLTDGNMDFKHLSDVSPLLEDAIGAGSKLRELPSPRFFKTHGDYKYFPRKSDARIIYVVRNGMDVASSIFHYYKDYTMPDLKWDKYLNTDFMDRLSWFRHTAEWLENKNHLNVHIIQYENLTRNMRQTVEDLASFLKISPSEEVMERVLERCSFEYMKQNQAKFGRPKLSANKTDEHFIRKGESFKGQYEFTEEQREKFIKLYNKYLGKYNLGYDFSRAAINKTVTFA